MKRAENHISDYTRTSGIFLRFLGVMEGKQPGAAIFAAVASTAPPLHLMLEKYAYKKARSHSIGIECERTAGESIGRPTNHPS